MKIQYLQFMKIHIKMFKRIYEMNEKTPSYIQSQIKLLEIGGNLNANRIVLISFA